MTAVTAENPHAGRGRAVPLDIGGDVGALVVAMPAELEGVEIDIRPVGRADATHVAVVARPTPSGRAIHSAVFFELAAGPYELCRRPDGPVRLRVDVVGGRVTRAEWPGP
jgi:hypothetical protein